MSEIQSFQPIPTAPPNNGSSDGKTAQNKPKRIRKTVGIPTVGALSTMVPAMYAARVEKDATPWERIENYDFYSPSADGSRLMMKISKSKSLDIKTQQTLPTSYGQAHRIHMEANPSKPDF